jgi:hypothetical protein
MSAPFLDKTPIVVRVKRSVKRDLKKLARAEHEPTVNSLLATIANKAAEHWRMGGKNMLGIFRNKL